MDNAHERIETFGAEYVRADLVPGWQPIETAPKDGSDLILWPGLRRPVTPVVGAWLDTKGGPCWYDLSVGHHNGFWKPTHWMPMPAAPEGVA